MLAWSSSDRSFESGWLTVRRIYKAGREAWRAEPNKLTWTLKVYYYADKIQRLCYAETPFISRLVGSAAAGWSQWDAAVGCLAA